MKKETFFNKMDSINADEWESSLNNFSYFVKARDPFMSGWGGAPRNSYIIVLCEDEPDVMAVKDGLRKDGMKNIDWFRISNIKSLTKHEGDHFAMHVCYATKWWCDNIWKYKDRVNEPSRLTRFKATGLRCHKTKVPAKKSKKLVCPEKMF